jgi:glycosyltransferase involved in cell wall biosynthesis
MRILYLCPDNPRPSGGVRAIYQHVDILVRNGYDAAVLHERVGFRAAWFPNTVPILSWTNRRYRPRSKGRLDLLRRGGRATPEEPYLFLRAPRSLPLAADDLLVVPEILAHRARDVVPAGSNFVLLNQHGYVVFRRPSVTPSAARAAYRDPGVLGVLVTSRDGYEVLAHTFPGLSLHVVRYAIDTSVFRYVASKRLQIGYMPRRGADDARHVLGVLEVRGALDGVTVVPIDRLDEAATAQVLGDSLLFMAVSYQEGFGLPPAEAMACGSIVVGYHAFGGKEFFRPELTFPIPTGDVSALVRTIEDVLRQAKEDPVPLRDRGRAAAEFIAREYAPERQEEDLLAAWRRLLA